MAVRRSWRLAVAVLVSVVAGCGGTAGLPATRDQAGLPSPPSATGSPARPTLDPTAGVTGSTDPAGSPAPAAEASRAPIASTSPVASPVPTPTASPVPTPAASPTPAPVFVPLVPVTGFWSTERSISRSRLAAAVAGSGSRPRSVLVGAADLAPLLSALGVTQGSNVRTLSVSKIRAALAEDPGALGFLRAEDVTPAVRALAVDGVALFGEARLRDLAAWPLLVSVPAGARRSAFDPSALWTLAAGGDVMLDREVYRLAVQQDRGADYPWDGGTARITGRACCGAPGWEIVRGRRTGHAGAVRTLLAGADVALVNLEGPAPDRFSYHPRGYAFSMDPALLSGLDRAGIDVVSLANNHIANAGSTGIIDTIRNLERRGIAHAGAGRTSLAARRPAWLTRVGLRIAVLGYNGIDAGGNATPARAGAAPLHLAAMRADIRAARRAGADVVIVVPHWGREYTEAVAPAQRRLAAALVRAGADLVLGSHSHWAGPLELVDGHLVVYSLGDLVFDLQHDARTQQALIVEVTFVGRRAAQVELHPTLILEASQPNLLEPRRGGDALLQAIRRASDRLAR
jgi:poly-gamma-glutamate capsule biosynthesis protein CapA/YwtB (metallophosphatase superfamily)